MPSRQSHHKPHTPRRDSHGAPKTHSPHTSRPAPKGSSPGDLPLAPQPPPHGSSAPDNPTFRLKNGLTGTETATTITNNNEIRRRNRAIPPHRPHRSLPAPGARLEAGGWRPWGGGHGAEAAPPRAGRGRDGGGGTWPGPPLLCPPQTCEVVVWCFLSATGPSTEAKLCLRS